MIRRISAWGTNHIIQVSVIAITVVLLVPPCGAAGQSFDAAPNYAKLRSSRAVNLSRTDGLLSIVVIRRLSPGRYTVGTGERSEIKIPRGPEVLGHLAVDENKITLFPRDQEADGGMTLPKVSGQDLHLSGAAGWLQRGGLSFAAYKGSGHSGNPERMGIIVKDTNAPGVIHFPGLRWYEPKPKWRVTAHWVPYVKQKVLTIGLSHGEVIQELAVGYAEFILHGRQTRLDATIDDGHLFFVIGDLTNQTTTYQGGRFLEDAVASNGIQKEGTVELDFNRLTNPYCAYASFENCPRPTRSNTLPIAVEAGEKRFGE